MGNLEPMISLLPLALSAAILAGTPSSTPHMAQVSPALVTTLSGNMNVVQGLLKATVVPSNNPQTITLMVGSAPTPVTGCLVVGSNPYAAGTPFTVIRSGSSPLASNFTGSSVTATTLSDFTPATSRRTVPMNASGVLGNSLAFPGTGALLLLYPPSTSGGYSFVNGTTLTIDAFPTSYSISWPTTAVSPTGTVFFPLDEFAPFLFSFLAKGPKSNILIGGQGNVHSLTVASTIDNPATTFVTATFSITKSTAF